MKAHVQTTRMGATAHLRKPTHLFGSVHLSPQTSKAILRADFPFVLKGRSYDCQPQSSQADLGVYLFLLQANFHALPHHPGGGNYHYKDGSLPDPWHTLLFNSPGSPRRYFSSAIFPSPFFTPRPSGGLKFPSSSHLSSWIKLAEGICKGCSWLGVAAGGGGGCRFQQVLLKAEGTTMGS